MSVHYKFKSTLDFDTITFDGLYISVADLKRAILLQKRLGKLTDFDLQVTNAQTKEEYNEETCLIPKNTSLIIARIPLTQPKKSWETSQIENNPQPRAAAKVDGGSLDLSKMEGTEEDKIQAMMLQSTADYDPKSYQRIRGQTQTGEVPPNYRCNRCKKTGHWIKNCPFNVSKEHMEVKRNTGIPRSFLEKDREEKLQEELTPPPPAEIKKQEIPEDLICTICSDLFTDAVMIPCCGSSFCDDCVRTALLESEENECPDCKEKNCSPESLIPNRFLRNSVNVFKNETGYKAAPVKRVIKKVEEPVSVENKDAQPENNTQVEVNASVNNSPQENDAEKLSESVAPAEEVNCPPQSSEVVEEQTDIESNTTATTDAVNETTTTTTVTATETASPSVASATVAGAPNPGKTGSPVFEETESDYEDNITVTVPHSQTEAQRAAFRERPFNEPNPRALKPPGIDSSPRNHVQASSYHQHRENERRSPLLSHPHMPHWEQHDHEHERERERDRDRDRGREQKLYDKPGCYDKPYNSSSQGPMQVQSGLPYCGPFMDMSEHPMRQMNSYDMFPDPGHRMGMYAPMPPGHNQMSAGPPPPQVHGMGSFNSIYNPIAPRPSMG